MGGSHSPNSITARLDQGYRPDRFQSSREHSTIPVNAPPIPLSEASYNVSSDRQGRTRPFQWSLGDSTLISSFHTAHTGLPESVLEHQYPSDRSLSPMGTISSMISSLSREGTIEPYLYQPEMGNIDDDDFEKGSELGTLIKN